MDNIENELESFKDILIVTTMIIPTKKIIEVKGLVQGFALDGKHRDIDFINGEKEARLELLKAARKIGVNGIVSVALNSITYSNNNQSSIYSLMYYTGTAVVIE